MSAYLCGNHTFLTRPPVQLVSAPDCTSYATIKAEDRFFNNFYSITSSASNIQVAIENLNQSTFPVMLSGEAGSGKEQVARVIYSQSPLRGNPLITINCAY